MSRDAPAACGAKLAGAATVASTGTLVVVLEADVVSTVAVDIARTAHQLAAALRHDVKCDAVWGEFDHGVSRAVGEAAHGRHDVV